METKPDIYTDSISIYISEWGVSLDVRAMCVPEGPLEPGREPPIIKNEGKAVLRMTHAHAKAFAVILRRQLKGYEDQSGMIRLPPRVADQLKIQEQDW